MLYSVLLTALFLSLSTGQVIDLATNAAVAHSFLESGFVSLSPAEKITVSTSKTFTNPVVFLSTVFSKVGYSDDIPVQARMTQLVDNNGANQVVTFTVSLVWPSNKTCVSAWYDGSAPQGSYTVGWYVGESGGYSVSGVQMEFVTTTVNAVQWNLATWPYPFGTSCNYPAQGGDDDFAPGALFTIQSNYNTGQYLTVRSSQWFKTSTTKCDYAWAGGHLRLYPHDHVEGDGLMDITSIQDEVVGVFLFDTRKPQSLDCVGGSYIEIGQINDLTSSPHRMSTYEVIDTSAINFGVFGAALTLTGGDAMMVKSYSQSASPTEVYSFIQEDKCADAEIVHYPETFSYFLATPNLTDCSASTTGPILGDHTFAPSLLPTTPSPSLLPTALGVGSEGSDSSSTSKTDDILLAVFLPIGIIIVVAVVGFVTKKVFLTPAAEETSEHSGLNLMP